MNSLDAAAKLVLRMLQPGDMFTVKDEPNRVFRCGEVKHPVEAESYVKCYEQEGPAARRRDRMYRMVMAHRLAAILPEARRHTSN